jgi:hypothetical protein
VTHHTERVADRGLLDHHPLDRLEEIQVEPDDPDIVVQDVDPAFLEAVAGDLLDTTYAVGKLALASFELQVGEELGAVLRGQVGRDPKR